MNSSDRRIHGCLFRALADSESANEFLSKLAQELVEDATGAGITTPSVEVVHADHGVRTVVATAGRGRPIGSHDSVATGAPGTLLVPIIGDVADGLWLGAQPASVIPSGDELDELTRGISSGLRRLGPLLPQSSAAAAERRPWYLTHLPLAVLEWDIHGKLCMWSGAAERVFGWRADEVLGKNWSEWRFVHEDDRAQVEAAAQRLFGPGAGGSGHIVDSEVVLNRNYTRDGRVLECRWHNHVGIDARGRPTGLRSLVEDISESAALKRAVEASRDQLATYLGNAPFAIIEWDQDLRVRRFAGAAERILGVPAGKVIGKAHTELAFLRWPDGRDPLPRLLSEGGGESFVVGLERADGTLRSARVQAFVFPSFTGRIGGLITFLEDITERIEAQSALAERESTYRTLVESSPYCIHQVDRTGTLLSINPAGLEMLGLASEGEVLGKSFLRWIARRDHRQAETSLVSAAAGKPSVFSFTSTSGRVIESTLVPLGGGNPPASIMGLSQDVTERRAAEVSLRETEQRLELAVTGAELGLWDWHVPSNRLVLSAEWLERLGHAPAAFGSEHGDWIQLVHPDDVPRLEEKYAQHLAGHTPGIEAEYRVRAASSEWRWVLTKGRVVERSATGEPLRAAGTHLDVTLRRRLTEQLTQSQKMESVGQLAGGIAHDFNNLLLVMLSNVYLAGRAQDDSSPELRDRLDEIRRAAERAAELTQKLLLFSRREVLKLVPVDIGALVSGIVPMIRRLIPESIDIDVIPHGRLPAVLGDAGKLEQVLVNLSVNARDAMPDGGRLTIEAESVWINGEYRKHHPWAVPGRYVLLTVSDSGVGLTPEIASHMFEPFFTTKAQGVGTGLGLAVVHGIIEQHHGMVNAYGEPGKGTTIKIYLPMAERAASAVGDKLQAPVPRGHGQSILVAEDDELVQRLVVRILEAGGYTVTLAKHGLEAVELFAASPDDFELVLLDVVMPRLSGREAFERIRALRPGAKVLFTSGYSADSLPVEFLRASGSELFPKPYDPDGLLRRIAEVLSDPRQR